MSWRSFGVPIYSIVCEKDKYADMSNLENLRLGSEVFVIEGASHSMAEIQSRERFF